MHARLPIAAPLFTACVAAHAAAFTANEDADLPDLLPGNGFCNVFPQPGAGPCTLRAAIMEANALAGADTIDLIAGFHYVLDREGQGDDTAALGDLDITGDLTIRFFASGEWPVVSAGGIDRVFDVIAGDVTLLGFDIVGGAATSAAATSGGGLLVHCAGARTRRQRCAGRHAWRRGGIGVLARGHPRARAAGACRVL